MIDLNYKRQLEHCFKKNVDECPRGVSIEIFQIVQKKKKNDEKKFEEVFKNQNLKKFMVQMLKYHGNYHKKKKEKIKLLTDYRIN